MGEDLCTVAHPLGALMFLQGIISLIRFAPPLRGALHPSEMFR